MSNFALTSLSPWLIAARPVAHPMIALPLLFGQALALITTHSFEWLWLFYCLLFGVICQAYVLYLNDYADEPLDRMNEDYWLSGGSRVIPDGHLTGQQLCRAALWLAGLMVVLGVFALWVGRPWMLLLVFIAIALGWSYSLPPIKASYRGFGEAHQAVSCGVLLPLIGFYSQAGSFMAFPWIVLVPLVLLFFASNIITALPDITSDRAGGKQTYPVKVGLDRATRHAVILLIAANVAVLFITADWLVDGLVGLLLVMPSLFLIVCAMLEIKNIEESGEGRSAMHQVMLLTISSQAWLMTAWTILLFWLGISSFGS